MRSLGLVLLLASAAQAEPYASLRGGFQSWQATSNQEELESGTTLGASAGMAIGDELGLSDIGLPKSDFALDAEFEGLWRHEPLHGRNHCPQHRTADGADLEIGTIGVNLWPGWQATKWLTLSLGGGGGLALLHALGDTDEAPFWQIGAGIRVNLTQQFSIELMERSIWISDRSISGYRAEYEGIHGFLGGLRWEFR